MSRFFRCLFRAACFVLLAVLFLWFWPVILQDMASGQWQRRGVKLKKINRMLDRLRLEKKLRKEHESRRKRVWKNRNNFYK